MSFYYLIDQYSLPSTLSFTPSFHQQHSFPLHNFYFLQQEQHFIQNLSLDFQQYQIPFEMPLPNHLALTQEPERVVIEPETQQKRTVKKSRRRNVEKQLQSAKKNSESNIINQLYSFFNSLQKSQKIVERAIKQLGKNQSQIQKIKAIFYNSVRLMNYKRGRRYVNKQTIKQFYTPDSFLIHIPDINQKLADIGILSLQELCTIFRVCTYHYIKCVSITAILSSKRISVRAKREHLKRRRLVLRGLVEFIQ